MTTSPTTVDLPPGTLELVRHALAEDLTHGPDVTTTATGSRQARC
jgi:hypothetical protein